MFNCENLRTEIEKRLAAHDEWLLIHSSGKSFPLKSAELEVKIQIDKILFGFISDQGFQTWRVTDFSTGGEELIFRLARNFGREKEKIRLVPRAGANVLVASVETARLAKANRIAALVAEQSPPSKIVRVELNAENGRFAQITLEDWRGARSVVLSDVSESLTPEILLAAACVRLRQLSGRRRNPVAKISIAGERKEARKLQKLHALLCPNWQRRISIREIARDDSAGQKEVVRELETLKTRDLWRAAAKEIKPPVDSPLSAAARKISALAPEEIDVVFSRHGETLRFRGLPFARVRRFADREKVWFGTEKSSRPLTAENWGELRELIEELIFYRRADSPNKRHFFYRHAPEAWLEAALRRNVKQLDPNLILSPLYHQFRAGRERVDLLALRRDGRLTIIELKVAPDREMIFQAVDYWRKIEAQRRAGNLARVRLFGDASIADRPAICYLVAPLLSFHGDFDFLSQTATPEIELNRFDLAENWRAEIRVLRRR